MMIMFYYQTTTIHKIRAILQISEELMSTLVKRYGGISKLTVAKL